MVPYSSCAKRRSQHCYRIVTLASHSFSRLIYKRIWGKPLTPFKPEPAQALTGRVFSVILAIRFEVKLGMKQRLKFNLRKRQIFFTIVLLTTVGISQLAHFLEKPIDNRCTGVGYLASNRPTTTVHALRVVVKPWWGRHQVYGVFPLPFEKCNLLSSYNFF